MCGCGRQFRIQASGAEKAAGTCPDCNALVIIPNCESCESQLVDIRIWCEEHGYELVAEFSDKALSGGDDCSRRPGLYDAKIACKRGWFLVVRNLDRLFRNMDRGAFFRAELNAKGVGIVSLEQPDAGSQTPTSKLMAAIYDFMAESRRETIRATTRAKMILHQTNGRKMSARPPYGFSVDPENPKKLLRNASEQSHIRKVKDLYREGSGLREIARWMEQQKIPRRGKPTWTHQLVRSILVREGLLPPLKP